MAEGNLDEDVEDDERGREAEDIHRVGRQKDGDREISANNMK